MNKSLDYRLVLVYLLHQLVYLLDNPTLSFFMLFAQADLPLYASSFLKSCVSGTFNTTLISNHLLKNLL